MSLLAGKVGVAKTAPTKYVLTDGTEIYFAPMTLRESTEAASMVKELQAENVDSILIVGVVNMVCSMCDAGGNRSKDKLADVEIILAAEVTDPVADGLAKAYGEFVASRGQKKS